MACFSTLRNCAPFPCGIRAQHQNNGKQNECFSPSNSFSGPSILYLEVSLWIQHTPKRRKLKILLLFKEVAETTIVINRYFRCFKMLEAMLITCFSLDFYSLILALTVNLACSNYYSSVLMRIL